MLEAAADLLQLNDFYRRFFDGYWIILSCGDQQALLCNPSLFTKYCQILFNTLPLAALWKYQDGGCATEVDYAAAPPEEVFMTFSGVSLLSWSLTADSGAVVISNSWLNCLQKRLLLEKKEICQVKLRYTQYFSILLGPMIHFSNTIIPFLKFQSDALEVHYISHLLFLCYYFIYSISCFLWFAHALCVSIYAFKGYLQLNLNGLLFLLFVHKYYNFVDKLIYKE